MDSEGKFKLIHAIKRKWDLFRGLILIYSKPLSIFIKENYSIYTE